MQQLASEINNNAPTTEIEIRSPTISLSGVDKIISGNCYKTIVNRYCGTLRIISCEAHIVWHRLQL